VDFTQKWSEIRRALSKGLNIQTWSAAGGDLDRSFRIERVGPDAVDILPTGGGNIQSVSRRDFEFVWSAWDDYKARKVPRYRLTRIRTSSYVIGILHYVETR